MLIHVNFQPNPYSKSWPSFSVEELALIFLGWGVACIHSKSWQACNSQSFKKKHNILVSSKGLSNITLVFDPSKNGQAKAFGKLGK